MTIQFQTTRTDGTRGEWHDILSPDGFGRRWLAPDQGWVSIEFREKPAYKVTAKPLKERPFGYEVHIEGVGVTQAAVLDNVEPVARDYIAFDLDVHPGSFDVEIDTPAAGWASMANPDPDDVDGYAALAESQDAEDAAYHDAMRARARSLAERFQGAMRRLAE